MPHITYGVHGFESEALPVKSTVALLTRGLAHYLGNEVSAKVVAHYRAKALEEAGNPTGDEREDVLRGLKLDSESPEYKAVKAKFQKEAMDALMAGTVGEARGPRQDPFAVEVAKIVKAEVVANLRAHGLHTGAKHPTAEQSWSIGGTNVSFADLQDRWLAKHKDRIHKEAKTRVDAEARKARLAAETAAKHVGPVTMESIGF